MLPTVRFPRAFAGSGLRAHRSVSFLSGSVSKRAPICFVGRHLIGGIMELSSEMSEAYRSALYEVRLGENVITLSCGGVQGGDTSLFFGQPVSIISAWNPSAGSTKVRAASEEENSAAHRCLERYLQRRGHEFYAARNSAPDGSAAEDSLAVFGLKREEAAAIGRAFGQAAVFYFAGDSTVARGEVVECGEDVLSCLRRLPLVELHIHAEGAMPAAYLLDLVRRRGGEEADHFRSIDDVRGFLKFRNFYEFIQKWLWMLSLIRSEEDYADLVFRVMQSLRDQGVLHAEVHFSPFDFVDGRLQARGIAEAAVAGMRRATTELGMSGCLIADLVRNHPVETAHARIDLIAPLVGEDLVGMGLGGNEAKFPPGLFIDAFAHARQCGFRTVAHAGETAGAASVRAAVEDLRVERIGHGLRAMEDASVVALLRERGIPLEVCLSSNEATGVLEDVARHPLRQMMEAGLILTPGSDDPTMFGATLLDEYRLLISDFQATSTEIQGFLRAGIESSFASADRKAYLLGQI